MPIQDVVSTRGAEATRQRATSIEALEMECRLLELSVSPMATVLAKRKRLKPGCLSKRRLSASMMRAKTIRDLRLDLLAGLAGRAGRSETLIGIGSVRGAWQ
jgi:hypothetical protein